MGRGGPQRHVHDSSAPILSWINDMTKWWVSATVFAVLVVKHDASVAWAVLGSIVSSFLNKVLKYVINEQRPASARKADPGMPSSHANSLAFLGAYASLAVLQGGALWTGPAAGAVLAVSLFLTWLRVRLGFHTLPQVLVGYSLGAFTALAWHRLGARHALPAAAGDPRLLVALYGLTGAAIAAFAVRNVLSWMRERKAKLAKA